MVFSRRTGWTLTPNRLSQAQRRLQTDGVQVLDLTLSNPTRAELSYDEDAILQSLVNPAAFDYDPQPKGQLAARKAVAGYYRKDHAEFTVDPEAIFLTTSTSEAYSYVFRLLCNPGDEILVAKPSYPLFEFLADLNDVRMVPYPLLYDHGWQIDFASLYKAVNPRTRAVVAVHPNNPTGSYVSQSDQAALNRFCREYGLALIVDEVFLDYAHDGISRSSFAGNQDVLTFTLSGVSKISGLPQMKLAWLVTSGPAEQVRTAQERLEVIADTYLSMNAPIQLAAPVLLDQRKRLQPVLLDRLRTNLAELDRQLARQKSCQRLQVEAGWYAILRVPVTRSDEELTIELLEKFHVLVHPGHFYDFPSEGYLVVSLIAPPAQFREAIEKTLRLASG